MLTIDGAMGEGGGQVLRIGCVLDRPQRRLIAPAGPLMSAAGQVLACPAPEKRLVAALPLWRNW